MKPTILALSLIAPLTVAAQTPSAGQVDGLLDAGVVAERTLTRVDSGIASGSRVGTRGREGLGDGSIAVFTREASAPAYSGANDYDGKLLGRQAYERIEGAPGVLTMGRQYNLVQQALLEPADPFQSGMAGNADDLAAYTTQRYDNAVRYQSKRNRSGLIGSVVYSLAESPFNTRLNRAYDATLGYANGRVNLSITHQRKDNLLQATGTTPAVDQSARNSLVAANVDFGSFTGYAAYGRSRGANSNHWDMSNPYGAMMQSLPTDRSRDALFGIAVPMGATTFMASYIVKDDRGLANRDANQFAVGASYAMSPRTNFYAALAKITNRNGAGYSVGDGSNRRGDHAINVGLRHAF